MPTSARSTAAATTSRTRPGDRSVTRTRASRRRPTRIGVSKPLPGPPARSVSNRIYNDASQNLFSENGVTQWGFVWGQFLDHTFGLRDSGGGESAPIAFDAHDPLEAFRNDFGAIDFTRTPAAAGTGVAGVPREQDNTVSSYIDAWPVYGGTDARLEWLREGPVNGDLSDNGAHLLLDPGGLLPRRASRGDSATAPAMELQGRLAATPAKAMVAGDVRANENVALTATQTLFAREHNRIVDALPAGLSEQRKFEIARRVVGAEEQFITYEEFLPALGVKLAPYRGYDPAVNATLGNEFATVGYRAHSMVHGEIEPSAPAGTYSEAQLEAFEDEGIEVDEDAGTTELEIPLNLTFGNPDLLASVGVGPILTAVGGESEYRNDETIDNQLRSVLFQVPFTPGACLDGPPLPACFNGVVDLGALDVERGRDHGIPLYNDLRRAYGLAAKPSFAAITGEATEQLPAGIGIDDPSSLDWTALRDITGAGIPLHRPAGADERGVGRAPDRARRPPEGDLRHRRHARRVHRDALRAARAGHRVRRAAAGDVEAAVRGAARRRPLLLSPTIRSWPRSERDYGISAQRTLAQLIEDNTGLADPRRRVQAPRRTRPDRADGGVGATVRAALSLSLGAPASFGAFSPGVAKDYTAATTATVISTAGDAALTVSGGRLTNGVLPAECAARGAGRQADLDRARRPTTRTPVTFTQHVGATDPLRTGSYSAQLTFTLSTTAP